MTSSDQHPNDPAQAPEGAAPVHPETPAPAAEGNHGNVAPPDARADAHDDDGPQPGNQRAADDGDGEDEDEGPAPGNERVPEGAAAAGPAGATAGGPAKKKRRRRRKKKGDGAHAGEGASGAGGEAGPPVEGAAAAEGAEGEQARHDRPKKKDRPAREPRERPAFNYGDVVFGKIVEITDDALFVDLSGKARAIFDRREMDLPDDLEYGADPEALDEEPAPAEGAEAAPAAAEGEAGAEAQAGSPSQAPTQTEEPVSEAAEAAAPAEAAPVEVAAPAAEAAAPAEAAPEAPAAAEAAPVEAAAEAPRAEPLVFPVVVLEMGAHFVGIVHNDGGRGGLVVLTRHPKRQGRAKLVAGGAFKEKGEILGLVTGVIKGGVEVDVDGLRAFAPGSHMDLRLGTDLHPLVGKRLLFVVTQYAKRGKDVVLSRKPFLEAEAKLAREAALKTLQIGAVVEGTVRSVVPFGAFLDVGGVEGLVPLSEMSHNRGDGPHDVFKAGEKTPVKIMKVDERGKVWLSRRAAIPDPWMEVAKKYAVGTKLTGKIARLQPFGAFVELEPGIDGLIHTADLTLKRIEHPQEVVKEGDSIDVVVVHLEVGAHRIGLHPAPTGEAANETPQRVQLNKPVKVSVVGYEGNGLIVRILGATGRHARGFISAAATGTPRGTDLRREFPMNKVLDAKVTELDPRRGEIKLSVKALSEDTERTAYRQYREQVTREAKFGTFGDLLKKNLQK
ncbi:MAG TPA: S1 RNA-binding domain-containing protein [Polyangiaceae bacterium]|jgi:small subunit ribosomal protein S1